MSQTTHLKFRYDINALRAISVIGVLLFHYKVSFFDGGFAGVDVFFVISGYLMSKIIINGLDRGNFSIFEFYGRRLKRIVPALLGLVLVLTLVGFFIYFPANYQLNQKNAAASILFISNFVYWQSAGYFAEASDTNILLHTWSLSVEWQFYLIYPVILLFANKFLKNRTQYIYAFVVVILIGYWGAINYTSVDKEGSFFLLHSRAWEMMLGGLAFLCEDLAKSIHITVRKLVAITGYVTIFACFYFLNSTMAWPGLYTMVPVLAAFIIIAANCNDFKLLKFGVVQGIGKISYSLYLWHWPVYVIAQYLGFPLNNTAVIALTAISFVLGYLSYRFIESINFTSNKTILAGAFGLLLMTGYLAYFDANQIAFKHDAVMVAGYNKRHPEGTRLSNSGCFLSTNNKTLKEYNETACLSIKPGSKNFILIGDSHAADISEPFRRRFKGENINVMIATASGCYPFITEKGGSKVCLALVDHVLRKFIVQNTGKIDGVIISANWVKTKPSNRKKLEKDLRATIDYLEENKLKVILIGQSEAYTITYPVLKAKELQFNTSLTERYFRKQCYVVNNFLKKRFKPYYVDIINRKTIPPLGPDYTPYIFDKDHFTPYGGDLAINKILADSIGKALFN
ncbi:MAG: acyltransferase [Sphingobacteriaceae bacterium]|nr:MAG: acyltransferase [Sphingobacteriaceae bacterium]